MSEFRRSRCWPHRVIVTLILVSTLGSADSLAVDFWGKRFDPPKIYFVHSTLLEKGVTSGIKEQENFLELFITSVANEAGKYTPDGFSYTVLVPSYVELVGVTHRFPSNGTTTIFEDDPRLTVTDTVWQGKPYRKIVKKINPARVKGHFLTHNSAGMNVENLWYRVDPDQEVPAEPQPIQVTLYHQDQECHTDKSVLRIYEALETPPRISPEHYKLWLYRGPRFRNEGWDELADYLGKAGINAIQFGVDSPLNPLGVDPANDQCMKEMRKRGFYIIVHRGGGYAFNDGPRSIYKQVERRLGRYEDDPLTMGPRWFVEGDGRALERYAPMVDAALWNFEPSSRPTLIPLDKWYTDQFKKLYDIPAEEEFDLVVDIKDLGRTSNWVHKEAIDPDKLQGWLDHRRSLIALCIKNWADFVRAYNPDIETIITEGNMKVKPGSGRDLGYEKFGHHVDYCQPMQFSGPAALQKMKQYYMKRAPDTQFIGCQSVSQGSYSPLFVSGEEIMLQQVGAALIGVKGVGFYAGLSMDAQEFVLLNRSMGFLGRHQDLIFEGTPDPANVTLKILPADDADLAHDVVSRAYHGRQGNEYLVAINNFNKEKESYLKVTMSLDPGTWFVVDRENKQVLTSDGRPEISSKMLGHGIYLKCPAYDFRGFRVMPRSAEARRTIAAYQRVNMQATAR